MMLVSFGVCWGGSLAVHEYITSRPAIYSSRSAFVKAEQTEQKEEGVQMWRKIGTECGSQVKEETVDANLLICSSRHNMTSAQVCLDLRQTSFIPIHKKDEAKQKQIWHQAHRRRPSITR